MTLQAMTAATVSETDLLSAGQGGHFAAPPAMFQTGQLLVSGTTYGVLVGVKAGTVVTNVILPATVAAAGLTLARGGIANSSQVMLGQTAQVSATVNGATGYIVVPLAAPVTIGAAGVMFVVWIQVGTTPTTTPRQSNAPTMAGPIGSFPLMFGGQTAQADLPANGAAVTLAAANGFMMPLGWS